ncbi:MAG TPA: DUF188 domain-containing protein [Treponemataceae bacterium]|nr:DUF188 domain-containing protein [Treponemataceae bacterium]
MTLWIDADSCPRQVRDLVCRAGDRLKIPVRFVANRKIPFPESPLCTMTLTASHQDAADDYIVENVGSGDMVITRDIPLAKRLVDAGMRVINDRGIVYSAENINERLSIRNLMLEMRQNGLIPEKTSQYGKKELQGFANALDREITRMRKESASA